MMTGILLSTILTASIAGAGLLIAIYTLIAQLRNKLFEKRLAILREKKAEFDKTKQSITPEELKTDELREIGWKIQSMKSFPAYLKSVGVVFTGYIICAFFSLFWLDDIIQNPVTTVREVVQNSQAEFLLLVIFFFTTVGFAIVVLYAVKDVHELMKADFEELKKEQEKVKSTRLELYNPEKTKSEITTR
jgi:hypothetical protein